MSTIHIATGDGQAALLFDEDQARIMFQKGLLNWNALYWKEGMSGWQPLHTLFAPSPPHPMPPPPQKNAPVEPIYTKNANNRDGAASQIPVSSTPIGNIKKGISAPKVIKMMQSVIEAGNLAPLRIGTRLNRKLDKALLRRHLSSIKKADSIPTAAQRLGNAFRELFGGEDSKAFDRYGFPANAASEMNAMGNAFCDPTVPSSSYIPSGFAEWFSVLVYGGDAEAKAAAPKFHEWFKAEVVTKNTKLSKAIATAQAASLTWRNQGDQERARQSVYQGTRRIRELVKSAVRFLTLWRKFQKTAVIVAIAAIVSFVLVVVGRMNSEPKISGHRVSYWVEKLEDRDPATRRNALIKLRKFISADELRPYQDKLAEMAKVGNADAARLLDDLALH